MGLLSSAGSGWGHPGPRETLRSGPGSLEGWLAAGRCLLEPQCSSGYTSAHAAPAATRQACAPLVAAGPYGCLAERGPIRARRESRKAILFQDVTISVSCRRADRVYAR